MSETRFKWKWVSTGGEFGYHFCKHEGYEFIVVSNGAFWSCICGDEYIGSQYEDINVAKKTCRDHYQNNLE